ncbi:MAG: RNase P subunit p30 family protein [Candidatus Bathyarchaeia archaeon]|jgi:RNase P/RNase MRP subunit p30
MKRVFADLHLKVNPQDVAATQQALEKAARFGYKRVGFAFSFGLQDAETAALKAVCANLGLDLVLRADFKPHNQEDLMRFLRKYRRKLEVICILCDDKEVARQAAKDRRVDLLNFVSLDYRKRFFDRAEAELARCSQTALEIDVKPLLALEGPSRVRLLTSLRREAALAKEFGVPIVLSSGVAEKRLMRMPHDLASLGFLLGLSEAEALDAVSTNPQTIVLRNREKLGAAFVAPGITVVKEGKA